MSKKQNTRHFCRQTKDLPYPLAGVDLNPNLVPTKFPPICEMQLSRVLMLSSRFSLD